MSNAHSLQSPTRTAIRWITAYYVAWVAHVVRRTHGVAQRAPDVVRELSMLVLHYAVGLVRLRESCIELRVRLQAATATLLTSGVVMILMT